MARNCARLAAKTLFRHAIEMPQQAQRVDERQIPPELGALAEDDADAPRQFAALAHRIESGHAHTALAGNENAGKHLDGRTFARAVRPDQADHLACFNAESRDRAPPRRRLYFRINNAAQAHPAGRDADFATRNVFPRPFSIMVHLSLISFQWLPGRFSCRYFDSGGRRIAR